MSDRKKAKAVQTLLRQIGRLYRTLTKALVNWLLRTALLITRKNRRATAGFVLPTTVLLTLVVTLTTGALTYRAFNTSTRTIGETQNRVIYNVATPAIDRARAKIEYLFDAEKDSRYPGGVPSERLLLGMMLNDGSGGVPAVPTGANTNPALDPYTLPDELQWANSAGLTRGRLDINGDGTPDNAWGFRADTDGDGTQDATVVYSIVFSTPPDNDGGTPGNSADDVAGWQRLIGLGNTEKATGRQGGTAIETPIVSYARSGPLSNATGRSCGSAAGVAVESGWYQDGNNSAALRKNFQVDAFVLPDSTRNGGVGNFATLEFQQDRKLDRGNKWGAWFRNDLEIFPGQPFRWNGAMHSEGSMVIGGNGSNNFNAYLISSSASCLFYPSASEITLVERTNRDGSQFKGLLSAGTLVLDDPNDGGARIHLHTPRPDSDPGGIVELTSGSDWAQGGGTPFNISSDPATIMAQNGYRGRGADPTNQTFNDAGNAGAFPNRVRVDSDSKPPYVDDTYRADNRYGPKVTYNDRISVPPGSSIGQLIPTTDGNYTALTAADPATGAGSAAVGLDGYWERRARNEGLRVLVGQRLELGNSNGWVAPQDRPTAKPAIAYLAGTTLTAGDGDPSTLRKSDYTAVATTAADVAQADPDTSDVEGDPLYPPYKSLTHEARQRRSLRDNIAAVQGTTVYHAAVEKDYPIACLASTAHFGSPLALQESINFVPTSFIDSSASLASTTSTVLLTDFFNGRGTNGWEFEPPLGSRANFETAIANANSPLRTALKNLAQFAGDHISETRTGAFPPTQEAGQVHPDPELSMWGNFSNLRRTIATLEGGTTYANLSPADKTYLQTAACTLGMLAYNIDRVQRFDPRNTTAGQGQVVASLGSMLYELMDGVNDPATNNLEVLPRERLSTYGYDPSRTVDLTKYNARDYDRVPAEAYLSAIRNKLVADNPGSSPNDPVILNDRRLRMAELLFAHFQVRRDRTYGFRPSPAANTWNYNPFIAKMQNNTASLWSSACDPNMFSLNGPGVVQQGILTSTTDTDVDATGQVSTATVITDKIANPDEVEIAQRRVGLSRLCGSVIPPGAVHDYPGDMNYPARESTTNETYLPKNISTNPALNNTLYTGASGVYGTDGGTVDPTPKPDPLEAGINAQQRLHRESQRVFNQGLATANAAFGQGVYLRASVAPKWPSLYYLFPEFSHGQQGAVINRNGTTVLDIVDHRQPDGSLNHINPATGVVDTGVGQFPLAFQPWVEPYITDTYVNTVNAAATYQVVDSTRAKPAERDYETATASRLEFFDAPMSGGGATTPNTYYTYRTFGFPIEDLSVASLALKPRPLPTGGAGTGNGSALSNPGILTTDASFSTTTWRLPAATYAASASTQNVPTNLISVPAANYPTSTVPVTAVVPFLDRVMFDGRQWQPTRVLDIDLGMLRRTRPAGQVSGSTELAPNDVWLPASGIVYAFREDAVREDAINRPTGATGCLDAPTVGGTALGCTNVTSADATLQFDPALAAQNVSVKPVDFVIDPDRRVHGFRLRNGSQLKRHASMSLDDNKNIRGLSFFTDNPVYIMGDYNLHISGADDDAGGTFLEEFADLLPDEFTEADFYGRTNTDYDNFAVATRDRWRPSEILADAITILSNNICDGTELDSYATAGTTSKTGGDPRVDASIYDNVANGLYGPNCTGGDRTTFLNQNRPNSTLPGTGTSRWTWQRENANESRFDQPTYPWLQPVKISRNGSALMVPPVSRAAAPANPEEISFAQKPQVAAEYGFDGLASYFPIRDAGTDNRPRDEASDTQVNSILINGIVPSRRFQSYGGLHNFPRLLETWDPAAKLRIKGSFIQINFSNYATAPFDQDGVEPGQAVDSGPDMKDYYSPAKRLWGYDVALQLAPAGPAAARFVSQSKDRNEFYNEPAANDPYIRNLCTALPDTVFPDGRCPS